MFFLPKDTKKNFKEIYFCSENLKKNDPYTVNNSHYNGTHHNTTRYFLIFRLITYLFMTFETAPVCVVGKNKNYIS